MENLASEVSVSPLRHIVVCGTGLAGQMTAAALAHQVPEPVRITWLKVAGTHTRDCLYGNVTAPTAYDFNLSVAIAEPDLILNSSTAFSYGTRYAGWGGQRRDWIQAFHTPFPIPEGVLLHHYLLQRDIFELEPYLVSAVAGRAGVFAHPPDDLRHPLSGAEYGYQFDPVAYGAVFERQAENGVRKVSGAIAAVERDGDHIRSIRLADGQSLAADLYIDCSGPEAVLSSQPGTFTRRLGVLAGQGPAEGLGAPVRTVMAGEFGWSSRTPVQGATMQLTVYAPESEAQALVAHDGAPELHAELALGRRDLAWAGNCVAIGHAAGVVEPVTCAPFILLQRDIQRLLTLLPVAAEMAVERREFNRQFAEDYRNGELFNRALFVGQVPDAPYWRMASAAPLDERLAGKIEQFESRALHVAYDLEPFSPEDWIILHFGMGRRPGRYDRVADQSSRDKVDTYLSERRGAVEQVVRTMPSHDVYRRNLANFLKHQGSPGS